MDRKHRFFWGTLLIMIFASGMIPAPAETDLEKLLASTLRDIPTEAARAANASDRNPGGALI